MGMAGWKALPSVPLGSKENKNGSGMEGKKEKAANIIIAFSHGKGI